MTSETVPPTTLRRLMKEYQNEQDQRNLSSSSTRSNRNVAARDENIVHLAPRDAELQDLLKWDVTIKGPVGGFYEGGEFDIEIIVPPAYPTKPPIMRFITRIWHPNVSWKTGEICLDVLSSQWSPAWTLSSACTAVIALLDSPEPDSPLNVDAATVFRTADKIAYKSMCRMNMSLWSKS